MSFSVVGDLGDALGAKGLAQLPSRIVCMGSCVMPVNTGGRFADAWWRFYVNQDAGMIVHGEGTSYVVPPNELVVLPAWLSWQIDITHPTHHTWIEVDCPHLHRRHIQERCDGIVSIPTLIGQTLVDVITQLSRGERTAGDGNTLRAGIEMAMGYLAEIFKDVEMVPEPLASILTVIQKAVSTPMTIPDIAEAHGMSAKTLTTLFQKHLGVTPAVYIKERRLARACELLRDTKDSIERIATQVGFANRAYLSRVMSQELGIPPATYRRR